MEEYLDLRRRHAEGAQTTEADDINLTLNTQTGNSGLRVYGNANVPDGAVISYEAEHKRWPPGVDIDRVLADGTTEVVNGEYEFSLDFSGWLSGEIHLWVSFTPINQPDEVTEIYGELGEQIPDDSAVDLGVTKRVEQTAMFVWNETENRLTTTILQQHWDSIEIGETYEHVTSVLNREGDRKTSISVGDREVEVYEWRNPHPLRCGIRIEFEDGRVDSKEEIGTLRLRETHQDFELE